MGQKKLGTEVVSHHEKLHKTKKQRDCLIILTSHRYVLINVHMPHEREVATRKSDFQKIVNTFLKQHQHDWEHVIVCGDFNDSDGTSLLPIAFHGAGNLKPTRVDLITCCYSDHKNQIEEGYKLKGDYILNLTFS